MISYGNAKILYSKKTTGNYHLNKQMTGGLYVNGNRWMSSNEHIGQTKIGLLVRSRAWVMVCLFSPSENMNPYVQGVYIE